MFLQRLRVPDLDLSPDLARLSGLVRYLAGDGRDRHRFIGYAAKDDDLAALRPHAERIRAAFASVVVLATGASAVGAKALICACAAARAESGAPRIHFADNLSASTLAPLLQTLDLRATHFLVISKSGRTVETLVQFMVFLEAARAAVGTRLAQHFTVITSLGDNPLRHLAALEGLPIFDCDPDLDGCFAAFSLVGALPMLVAGFDPARLRQGGAAMLERVFRASNVRAIPSALGAAAHFRLAANGKCAAHVLMTYDQRLMELTQWQRHLWAESLGKNGCGTTPLVALGPLDQHSQMQFYLEGPSDKFVTILTSGSLAAGPAVPEAACLRHPDLRYLARQRIADIVAAEAHATIETLAQAGRPLRRITISEPDEKTLGALMMHFMLETVFTAHLFGIDPYGQPAVREEKILAIDHLNDARTPPVVGRIA